MSRELTQHSHQGPRIPLSMVFHVVVENYLQGADFGCQLQDRIDQPSQFRPWVIVVEAVRGCRMPFLIPGCLVTSVQSQEGPFRTGGLPDCRHTVGRFPRWAGRSNWNSLLRSGTAKLGTADALQCWRRPANKSVCWLSGGSCPACGRWPSIYTLGCMPPTGTR